MDFVRDVLHPGILQGSVLLTYQSIAGKYKVGQVRLPLRHKLSHLFHLQSVHEQTPV